MTPNELFGTLNFNANDLQRSADFANGLSTRFEQAINGDEGISEDIANRVFRAFEASCLDELRGLIRVDFGKNKNPAESAAKDCRVNITLKDDQVTAPAPALV